MQSVQFRLIVTGEVVRLQYTFLSIHSVH